MEPSTELPPADGDALPTYEAATNRDPLALIAPYARREDLFSASLVSRQWRKAFMKELWKRPNELWKLGDRPVLTKFLLFLRTLSTTPDDREHARALSLADVQTSIYSALPAKWLAQVFLRLPALQSLALSSFPFFDHAALLAVPQTHAALHTLRATSCTNTTGPALVHLLARLPALVNLDLSGTAGAAHPAVLRLVAAALRDLRCLALRDLKLDDDALAPLLRGLGTRLRKLDVGANLLTDRAAALLLDWNFAPPDYTTDTTDTTTAPPARAGAGLTHLRIAANRVSSIGATALLKSTRLETLDLGASSSSSAGVLPALTLYAWRTLRTLRIDCRVVCAREGLLLQPGRLAALRNLVLCGVPERASAGFVADGIVGLLQRMQGSGVEVLELEMEGEEGSGGGSARGGEEDVGMYSSSTGDGVGRTEDFSFFSGDPAEGEGGSSWMGEGRRDGGREVDVIAEVGAYRKKCRETGTGWGGKVRVVRDLGGRGSIERGIGGERWGVVKEGV